MHTTGTAFTCVKPSVFTDLECVHCAEEIEATWGRERHGAVITIDGRLSRSSWTCLHQMLIRAHKALLAVNNFTSPPSSCPGDYAFFPRLDIGMYQISIPAFTPHE